MDALKSTAGVCRQQEEVQVLSGLKKLGEGFSQVFTGVFFTVLFLQALAGIGVVVLIGMGFLGVFN